MEKGNVKDWREKLTLRQTIVELFKKESHHETEWLIRIRGRDKNRLTRCTVVGRSLQLDVPIFNPNFRHQLVDLDLLHPLRVRHFLALCLHVHPRVGCARRKRNRD